MSFNRSNYSSRRAALGGRPGASADTGRFAGAALLPLLLGAAGASCGVSDSTDSGDRSRSNELSIPVGSAASALSTTGVLTQHNDTSRTGANLSETTLTANNIPNDQFGKLFARPVDGSIYAQPLYLSNVAIPGKGNHNVVYVATMNDSMYAFDADDPTASQPLWQVSFLPSGVVPVFQADVGGNCGPYRDIAGNIGINSTPVIDSTTGTIYLVAKTKESTGQVYRLHALDVKSGAERPNSPVMISASVPGVGNGSVNGIINFQASIQNQRAGLALANGRVYIGFASYCDTGDYHGWLLGYDQTTLAQTNVYNTTPGQPGQGQGGIWMSGQAPTVDAQGNVYVTTGNGAFTGDTTGGTEFSHTLLKLDKNLNRLDWFTPHNVSTLGDLDLGSGGVLLVPGLGQLVHGGKEGKLYAVDPSHLSHFNMTSDGVLQTFGFFSGNIHGAPVTWQVNGKPRIYVWPEESPLTSYDYANGAWTPGPTANVALPHGMPGGMLSISANGTTDASGIVWATHPFSVDPNLGDANNAVQAGVLQAFDARSLTLLWDSRTSFGRDDFGNLAKFTPPTVVNGKVYLATFSNQLVVYGRGNFTQSCQDGVHDNGEVGVDCGGSCAPCNPKIFYCATLQGGIGPGDHLDCDLGLPHPILGMGLTVGCDGETGSFTMTLDDGIPRPVNGVCNSSFMLSGVTTQKATLTMLSGGGTDNFLGVSNWSFMYY